MQLDVPTLSIVTVAVTSVLGALMLFAFLQNRSTRALLWWGAAMLAGALGVTLLGARGKIPNELSIDVANAIVFVSYGLVRTGLRVFDGRPVRLSHLFAMPAVWLAFCQVPAFYADINSRLMLSSAILASLAAAAAWEVWRGRSEPLLSRWPTIVAFLCNAALFAVRFACSVAVPISENLSLMQSTWFAPIAFGTMLFTIVLAFLLLMMAKERSELSHKTASLIDPLTGIANRRAFLQQAERRLRRHANGSAPLAVLLFDLDRFKEINDQFGHGVGDLVLRVFAETASGLLRPTDLVGRLGGEEFAAILPGASREEAVGAAERIRQAFALAASVVGGQPVYGTVSVGVMVVTESAGEISDFLAVADRALYRAKAGGRNRVETATGLGDVPGPSLQPVPDADEAVRAAAARRETARLPHMLGM